MVKVNVFKLSNSKAFGRQDINISSTMVNVKAFKPSNSEAFLKTRHQNFFNQDEGKGFQTKQF